MKQDIIEYSKLIGIDLIGFTNAEAFTELRPILVSRERDKYLSGFEEKDIEKRIDPRLTMEDAQSIIVIGQGYYHPMDSKDIKRPQFHGELARTAWGKDYHIVLKDKLTKLAEYINNIIPSFKYKAFVDTGPLVDRHVAHRAGLGWFGYNSTLINEKFGSWFFIGYMLNNLSIEPDEPTKSKCLECNLCIKTCPGGAIKGPYSFNSKKCLSYILQQRDIIPHEKREKLGNRLYGCDVCQSVCPHNKDSHPLSEEDFIPKEIPSHLDLINLLKMTNKEFKELFSKNASGWRGKKILQRKI